jgi:polyisoprenoid-binding protein YceI
MRRHSSTDFRFGLCAAIAAYTLAGATSTAQAPLAIDSARVMISGNSNVHPYTAATTTVRITRAQIDAAADGAVNAFEITIPAATLTSPREGLDKNMHKALKVQEHPDIVFRLVRFEGGSGSVKGTGVLRIAGVEREVVLDLNVQRADRLIAVKGQMQLLMTDYGIKPPTAMMGLLKTDPKVTVMFETVLSTAAPVKTFE